eukprot:CAMPEP_0195309100 /NCGR_PEP_ID=MMETSP0707-20130614/38568_1 /TAXON_ID=33640 /ORGANISM="Asterionellopsis glacialis, Strain CCMP134" /LENGTH=709 /DNA_ID=CAMNT_0040373397 /DNA_START=106 /DNA_END=2232 /DNA_ORIENTATION=-
MQVGTTLFIGCCVVFVGLKHLFPSSFEGTTTTATNDDDTYADDVTEVDIPEQLQEEEQPKQPKEAIIKEGETTAPTVAPTLEEIPPLPVWDLGQNAHYDAYGIMEGLLLEIDDDNLNNEFWTVAKELRQEFASRYGGENAARAMLERALSTFSNQKELEKDAYYPSDLVQTACRMKNKIKGTTTPQEEGVGTGVWKMAFGGYSVTVGRGNKFSQSFPFIMEQILSRPMKLLGLELHVRNAAIGGIPSFPYGWCLKNFWDSDPDVVSWDYAMNEAGGVPEGLEAYLRHITTLNSHPQLIVKDTYSAEKRKKVLQRYAIGEGDTSSDVSIVNTLLIHTDPAVDPLLDIKEKFRPFGFQRWREWGAPNGAPGQSLHHPAVKEHELIGWTLSMYFLAALELVAADVLTKKTILNRPTTTTTTTTPRVDGSFSRTIPPPMTVDIASTITNNTNTTEPVWLSLLYGRPSTSTSNKEWTLRPVHCRTSFEPLVRGDLKSIVVTGTAGDEIDLMLPKGRYFYGKGWVMDLSDKEKLAKRKLERYPELGFVDSKKAYYGVYESGPLTFLLPYEKSSSESDATAAKVAPKVGDDARLWFSSIVVCEVNEERGNGECQAESDMSYKVSGVNATKATIMDAGGTLYLGKKLCMYIEIPDEARITSRSDVLKQKEVEYASTSKNKTKMEENDDAIGISFEVQVVNKHVYDKKNACSVSHVVW